MRRGGRADRFRQRDPWLFGSATENAHLARRRTVFHPPRGLGGETQVASRESFSRQGGDDRRVGVGIHSSTNASLNGNPLE